jgi:hypothetical protein
VNTTAERARRNAGKGLREQLIEFNLRTQCRQDRKAFAK